MKRLVVVLASCAMLSAWGDYQGQSVKGWIGTAYHGGWFTYLLPSPYAQTQAVQLNSKELFLLSPCFDRPIHKVVLKVDCGSSDPARALFVTPFVNGVETSDAMLTRSVGAPMKKETAEYVHFNWSLNDQVTAFRIHLDGGSSGNWGLYEIHVFYGERTAEDDKKALSLVPELLPPVGLQIADFTETSLTVAAQSVEGAENYSLQLLRYSGRQSETVREDFSCAPEASPGWTINSSNAKLSDGGASQADGDEGMLKIEKAATSGAMLVEVASPMRDLAIVKWEFVCRISATGKSDRFAVYGRTAEDGAWTLLKGEITPKSKATNTRFSEAVERANDIRQVKFVFTADAGNFTTAGMDSLCVTTGGDETREEILLEGPQENPEYEFSGLESGRYAFRIRALASAASGFGDSIWSEESEVIDLSWATMEIGVPEGLTLVASGEKLTVSWKAVPGAVHYLVDVIPTDDPESPVADAFKTTATKVTLTMPAVGEYAVRVTAVSPCAKSVAATPQQTVDVRLEPLGEVTAKAMDPKTIVATWKTIPLADGYQAQLLRLDGNAVTDKPDFSGLPGSWPDGWTHYQYDTECYAGPIPKMIYVGSWIRTRTYDRPVTAVSYKFKSHATAANFADEIARTELVVSGIRAGSSERTELFRHPISTSVQNVDKTIRSSAGIMALDFRFDYAGDNPNYRPTLEFSVTSVTSGEETKTVEQSVRTDTGTVAFSGLDSSGRYQVAVMPLPSEDETVVSTSAPVDLGSEKFRRTGAVPLSSVRHHLYVEDFSCLSNQTRDVEERKVDLDYWQFHKGSGAVENLLYTSTTNRTTSGVYAFSDALRSEDSFMLGTLAAGAIGCSFGVAFRNDGEVPVYVTSLSFDAIQRNFRTNPSAYALEWLMTDGATDIGTAGDWNPIAHSETAPYTSETQDGRSEYRQAISVTNGLPMAMIPAGGVFLLRWRHEKISCGPMMAIDNVRIEFHRNTGLSISVK